MSEEDGEEKKLSSQELKVFLARNKVKPQKPLANISDLSEWKRKKKVDPSAKVFIISGGYKTIKAELLSRGWIRNSDLSSSCFDLKWVLKGKDIDFQNMQESQIVNHFPKSSNITTKIGISNSMKELMS